MANDNNGWIRCDKQLPELGDFQVQFIGVMAEWIWFT